MHCLIRTFFSALGFNVVFCSLFFSVCCLSINKHVSRLYNYYHFNRSITILIKLCTVFSSFHPFLSLILAFRASHFRILSPFRSAHLWHCFLPQLTTMISLFADKSSAGSASIIAFADHLVIRPSVVEN